MKYGFQTEFDARVKWIRNAVEAAGAKGVVFGNSGGKDSALVGILCKAACEKTIGVILPCESSRNFGEDRVHAELLAKQYSIETIFADLTEAKQKLQAVLPVSSSAALANINPRLRMTALYAVGQQNGCLVAGTGNLSERTMGYFTKWGDGGCDFNPIADLTATEVKEFLLFLNAPKEIAEKAPSAGLWEGQTDEQDMGLTYLELDNFIRNGFASEEVKSKIVSAQKRNAHKMRMPLTYGDD